MPFPLPKTFNYSLEQVGKHPKGIRRNKKTLKIAGRLEPRKGKIQAEKYMFSRNLWIFWTCKKERLKSRDFVQ